MRGFYCSYVTTPYGWDTRSWQACPKVRRRHWRCPWLDCIHDLHQHRKGSAHNAFPMDQSYRNLMVCNCTRETHKLLTPPFLDPPFRPFGSLREQERTGSGGMRSYSRPPVLRSEPLLEHGDILRLLLGGRGAIGTYHDIKLAGGRRFLCAAGRESKGSAHRAGRLRPAAAGVPADRSRRPAGWRPAWRPA